MILLIFTSTCIDRNLLVRNIEINEMKENVFKASYSVIVRLKNHKNNRIYVK